MTPADVARLLGLVPDGQKPKTVADLFDRAHVAPNYGRSVNIDPIEAVLIETELLVDVTRHGTDSDSFEMVNAALVLEVVQAKLKLIGELYGRVREAAQAPDGAEESDDEHEAAVPEAAE